MAQWYFSSNGQQCGPFGDDEARRRAARNPDEFVWREGFGDWIRAGAAAELGGASASASAPPPPRGLVADEIDYKIVGAEMQFVEVELDPGESVVAEAGAMMYKDESVGMTTIFGDGSRQSGSFMDKLLGAGKRLLTGESLFMTVFTHNGGGKAHAAFAAPYPGNIIPVPLPQVGGRLICQKDAFLCAAKGVSIGIFFQKRILTGLFGGEGFIMEKLEGDGLVFMHAGGTIVERTLAPGEVLHVDTGCVVGFEDTIDFDIQQVGGIKSILFGGEGVFFATLRGPGRLWLQSLPFSRLAGRMLACAPQAGGRRRDEGSVLGGLGDLLGGDRNF
ncbi:MAG: TIGR00266 family protein [Candidatus Polarisedimenticolia bacterium]